MTLTDQWFEQTLSERNFSYRRGAAAWKRGEACPPEPASEVGAEFEFWLGWRMACGVDFLRRRDLAERMGDDPERVSIQDNT